jgi:hypothetical protein
MVSPALSGVNIRDVHFNKGDCHAQKSIAERNTGMCEPSWVDDDDVNLGASLVDPVNQLAFMVALKVFQLYSMLSGEFATGVFNVLQSSGSVDLRLSQAEKI